MFLNYCLEVKGFIIDGKSLSFFFVAIITYNIVFLCRKPWTAWCHVTAVCWTLLTRHGRQTSYPMRTLQCHKWNCLSLNPVSFSTQYISKLLINHFDM